MVFKLAIQTLRSYFKLSCEYELYIFANTKISAAKDDGEIYINFRPLLVCHLLHNRLFDSKFRQSSVNGLQHLTTLKNHSGFSTE